MMAMMILFDDTDYGNDGALYSNQGNLDYLNDIDDFDDVVKALMMILCNEYNLRH